MKLIKMYNGNYKLVLNNSTSIEGTRHHICRHMWHDLDMEAEEIEFALAEMERLGLDTANFGVNGTFTHCTSSTVRQNVLVELKAIRSLREELTECYSDPNGLAKHEVGHRLLNLYIALNVDAAIELIEDQEVMHAA